MTVVYEKPGFLTITFRKDKNYILFKWYRFGVPLDEMKIAHKKALDILLKNNCYNYIAETSEVIGVLLDSVIQWWRKEWVPKLQQAGIKAVVTVVPRNLLAELSTKDWQATDFGGITMKNVKTLEEAEYFIKTLS